jgi:hypothetical protein
MTDEFGWGSHSACGETSNACLVANAKNQTPTYAQAQAICARDRARGWTDSGRDSQTISEIYADIQTYEPTLAGRAKLYPYYEWYGTDALAAVSKSLIGSTGGILIELGEAYKLPHMEAGVNYHFCVLGAYDDSASENRHFYLLNPDRVPRPAAPYGGDWVTIYDICNAKLCGMIRLFS